MSSLVFEQAYTKLNKAQKEAVDTIEGPVMVIAGPGTGKTQILTLRIANILLNTDARPENILALTFTESGARAMRERLRSYIGAEAYRVHIHTFHGFSEMLIRNYPDAYERVIGGRLLTDIEKIEILESILNDTSIKHIRPLGNPLFYVPYIGNALSNMKQEYIQPDDFATIIAQQETELGLIPKIHEKGAHKGKVRGEYQKKEKAVLKNKELLFVYRAYEALLTEKRLYDYSDMIIETLKALERNEDMLRDLQESYQYVLADEHQDVNGSQNAILELLASYHDSPNLFVVGDEKQAIYRFQGASLENFLYFEEKFSNTKTIALTQNYRSGQRILDVAHSLIEVESGPAKALRVPLVSEAETDAVALRYQFSHQAVEDEWVVTKVKETVATGVPKNEIAIIVRTNREVEQYAALLRKNGISATASADGDILGHPLTSEVVALMSAVVHIESEEALFRVLHASYWGLSPSDLVRIVSGRRYDRGLFEILGNVEVLKELSVENIDAVATLLCVLNEARKLETVEAPHRVLEYLLIESGFLDAIIARDAIEGGRVIRRLYDEVEGLVLYEGITTLGEVISMFDTRRAHNLPLLAPYIRTSNDAVQIMTAHKSKGLEFEHVFVPHLNDSLWGGRKRSEYFSIPLTKHLQASDFDDLDDERRLLYVAMTRAKRGLYMSHSAANTEGREFAPTRLFEDIEESLIQVEETKDIEAQFNVLTALTQSVTRPAAISADLLRTLFLDRGLSATALNNYLESPWNYLYRNVMRIPEVQALPMQFGTVLHNTLQSITGYHTKQQKLPTDTEIKVFLERELHKLPLTKEEYVRFHERGFEGILTYLDFIKETLPKKTEEEMKLKVMLKTGDATLPEIPLTGMIDRIDFDEAGNAVRVVDYKSGKPKTRGVIEGTTKSSNGNYKRQLVFYALLLSLFDNERYMTREGVLSFIEADPKGVIHEESYTITDAEIEDLKAEIIRVSLEIVNGTFLEETCDPATSNYCELVQSLVRKEE